MNTNYIFRLLGLPWFIIFGLMFFVPFCNGTTATITAVDQGDGSVAITASGEFDTCMQCDSQGQNCSSNDSGGVYIRDSFPNGIWNWQSSWRCSVGNRQTFYRHLCGVGGYGGATTTVIVDRAMLDGTHTFRAEVVDCNHGNNEHVFDSTTIVMDNTPTVSVSEPTGTVCSPFDIIGMATFKPTLNESKGAIHVYLSGAYNDLAWKNCHTEECSLSYGEMTGSFYDLPKGGPYTITVQAAGTGAKNYAYDKTTFVVDNNGCKKNNFGEPNSCED